MVNQFHSHCFGFLASLDFTTWTVEDVSKCLADLGYSAVEWTLAHFDLKKGEKALLDLVRIPERYGLHASEIVVQQDFVTLSPSEYNERVARVAACIPVAAHIGIPILNLFTGPAPWNPNAPRLGIEISEGQAWKLVSDAFETLLPLAEKYKVYLAVEAVFGHLCHDYYTLSELLHRFDSEYLAVALDPSHFQLYQNDVAWAVECLAPYIRHVHLKDVVGRPGLPGNEFTFPLLGEGVINWTDFLSALERIDYTGTLSVEFEAFGYYQKVLNSDPGRAAALSMEQIRQLFPGGIQ